MRPVRSLAVAAALVSLAPPVHAQPSRAAAAADRPLALALRGAAVDALEASGTTLAFSAELSNPTEATVLLGGVSYALDVEGKRVFEASVPGGLEVPAGGAATLPLPGRVRYADLPGVAAKVALGKNVPYRLTAAAAVRTGAGDVTVPVSYEGELAVPKRPGFGLSGLRITSMNPFDAGIEVDVSVENENGFPLPGGVLSCKVTVAGGEIASADAVLPAVGPRSKATMTIPLKVSLKRAGSGAVKALKGDAALVGLHGVASVGGLAFPVDLEARLPTIRR